MNTSVADVSLHGIQSGPFFSCLNHSVDYTLDCTFTETLSRPFPSLCLENDGEKWLSDTWSFLRKNPSYTDWKLLCKHLIYMLLSSLQLNGNKKIETITRLILLIQLHSLIQSTACQCNGYSFNCLSLFNSLVSNYLHNGVKSEQ